MWNKDNIFNDQLDNKCEKLADHLRKAKKAILTQETDTDEYAETVSFIRKLEDKGALSSRDTLDDGRLQLSKNLQLIDSETVLSLLISLLDVVIMMEENGIFPGIIDMEKIFFSPGGSDVCICSDYNFELFGLSQTWELCSNDIDYFGKTAFFPFTEEIQKLADLRLLYKILICRSNYIPDDAEMQKLLSAQFGGDFALEKLPAAQELLALVSALSGDNVIKKSESNGCLIKTAHVIYCIIPSNVPGSESYQKTYEALWNAKNLAGTLKKEQMTVFESFISPDMANDMEFVYHRQYSPTFTIDVSDTGYCSHKNALAMAAAIIKQTSEDETVYLNLIVVVGNGGAVSLSGLQGYKISESSSDCMKRLRVFNVGASSTEVSCYKADNNEELLKHCARLFRSAGNIYWSRKQ